EVFSGRPHRSHVPSGAARAEPGRGGVRLSEWRADLSGARRPRDARRAAGGGEAMDGENEMNLDSLERAYEALKGERWEDAAREAGAALRTADSAHAESEAALARFILGTALAGTSSGARQPAARKEARLHLEAALPHFRAAQAV